MRTGIAVSVTLEDRRRLEAIAQDRSRPLKHVARARALAATAEGCGTNEIMRRSALSKPAVWRWQERFMREGVDGLLRDKTRKPGKPTQRNSPQGPATGLIVAGSLGREHRLGCGCALEKLTDDEALAADAQG